MSSLSVGIMLAVIAGVLNGSFAAPVKYVKQWKWENLWSVWAVMAMLVIPWLVVCVTVPDVGGVYRNAGLRALLLPIAFGVGFGLAQIFFGLGIAAIGIALNFAIAVGLSTALGSIVPLFLLHREKILQAQGKMIFLGMGLMLIGIVGCALAGKMKEENQAAATERPRESSSVSMSFKRGLLICILAGVGSPLINFGLAFGAPLLAAAATQGVPPASQANVIWAPLVTASLVPYLLYCAHLCRRNQTTSLFVAKGTGLNWLFGAVMGLLWFGSIVIYAAASARMSPMGPILGWPLFMSAIIITSNAWGLATGEWKGAGGRALTTMFGGIFSLILGFVALALASRLS